MRMSRRGHEAGPIAYLDDEPLIDDLAKLSRGLIVNLRCISTVVYDVDGIARSSAARPRAAVAGSSMSSRASAT
jgi:hypothetical protein